MKVLSALKAAACLALAVNLCSCLASYDSGSREEDNDVASDNVVITDNSVTDGEELLEASPCDRPLWKPISEKDGNLAMVFPVEFSIPFSSIQVTRAVEVEDEAEEVARVEEETEFLTFSSFSEEGEQTWRGLAPGSEYTGSYVIDYSGESCSGEVQDPNIRTDLR